jgi:hypothetical protein
MIPTQTEYDDYRLIYKSSHLHLIELMKAKLRAEGIHVFSINKKDSSYNAFGDVELYVKSEDVVRAKFLIDQTNE